MNTVNDMKKEVGSEWVGSSKIHIGDHNVPNALVFIDKFNGSFCCAFLFTIS